MRIAYAVLSYPGVISDELVPTILSDFIFCAENGHEFAYFRVDAQPVDRARNIALAKAREAGCERILMLDRDVWAAPEKSALEALMASMDDTDAAAVAAVVVCRDGAKVNVDPVMPHEIYEANKVGAAMLLIDIGKLDNAHCENHVWFCYDGASGEVAQGEDVFFSREVKDAGLKLVANFQIPTRHMGMVPLSLESYLRSSQQ